MKRWYPTFPHGLPSIGLLFLRAAIGIRFIFEGLACILNAHGPTPQVCALAALAIAFGICFVLGLLTPLAATASALAEAAVYVWHPAWATTFLGSPTFDTIVVTLAIALLGPGSLSLDAYFFGRRKIVFSRVSRS